MKTLQSNFTTIEQSKRLLELGVPAWTADCFYHNVVDEHPKVSYIDGDRDFKWNLECEYAPKPCWSVGRLIEIYHICVGQGCSFTFHVCFPNLMNEIIYKIAEAKSNGWCFFYKFAEEYEN
jgi:hypothetical protein